ncbi:hypothetical protein SDRG_10356, partial [Saprolegnia diclina VS20]
TALATLYYVIEATRDPLVIWLMLIYRIWTTLFAGLWAQNYRHCAQLESKLRRCGHRVKMPSGNWTYELVLGDPTAIVLLDSIVATLYCLDIWASSASFGAMHVQSGANFVLSLLLGMLYLARTVWFAYWGLGIVSFGLQRWRKEHCSSEVDSMLVAIAVAIYGPIMAFINSHCVVIGRVEHYIFPVSYP